MPQLDFTFFWNQVFWLALCFFLFYGVCSIIVIPRTKLAFDRRAAFVKELIGETDVLSGQANDLSNSLRNSVEATQRCVCEITDIASNKAKNIIQTKHEMVDGRINDMMTSSDKYWGRRAITLEQKIPTIVNEIAEMVLNVILGKCTTPKLTDIGDIEMNESVKNSNIIDSDTVAYNVVDENEHKTTWNVDKIEKNNKRTKRTNRVKK